MNKEISKPTHWTIKIYSKRCLQSCVLHEITEDEGVSPLIVLKFIHPKDSIKPQQNFKNLPIVF